uniref:Uncharacterized protein n=1 Tax=Anopheles atroparvus TaxID=41427 RepID=A0AAG5D2K3_ANOAO
DSRRDSSGSRSRINARGTHIKVHRCDASLKLITQFALSLTKKLQEFTLKLTVAVRYLIDNRGIDLQGSVYTIVAEPNYVTVLQDALSVRFSKF